MFLTEEVAMAIQNYHINSSDAEILVLMAEGKDIARTLQVLGFRRLSKYWVLPNSEVNKAVNLLSKIIQRNKVEKANSERMFKLLVEREAGNA